MSKKAKQKRPQKKKTNQKKNKFFLFFKLSFIIALAVSVFFWSKAQYREDISAVSTDFNNQLMQILVDNLVQQSDLLNSFQTEKKDMQYQWITFFKTFSIERLKLKPIKRKLSRIAGLTYKVEEQKISNGRKFEIYYESVLINSLEFKFKKNSKKLAIIVDDLGYKKNIKNFLELDVDLTYAIMPGLPYSTFLAEEFSRSGIPYIIHMPMEAEGYPIDKLGPIYITTDMDLVQIRNNIEKAIRSVPGAKGMNNHMGSKFTSDSSAVAKLMTILKDKNMFFIDSRTSGQTKAYEKANSMGIKTEINDFYIDNKNDYAYILQRLKKLKTIAQKKGSTFSICHITRNNTAKALKEFVRDLGDVEIVPVEEILK